MESVRKWDKQELINELIQGMEMAKKLEVYSRTSASTEAKDLLMQKILSSYDKALLILRWNGSVGQSQITEMYRPPESPISINGSSLSDKIDKGLKEYKVNIDGSKKSCRKLLSKWTIDVRVSSENGFERPHDDGYSWRKYGQKGILGANYPRSYYRCTFRNTQSCWATKHVQRSDADPTVFQITYRGKHTCSNGNYALPTPESLEKQEQEQHYHNEIHHRNPPAETFTNFGNKTGVITENMNDTEIPHLFAFSPASYGCMTNENFSLLPTEFEHNTLLETFSHSILSPLSTESNYFFSPFPSQNDNFDGFNDMKCLESDITGTISTNASATNSPIPDLDFSLNLVETDSNFPF